MSDRKKIIIVGLSLVLCVNYSMADLPTRLIGGTGGLLEKDHEATELAQKIKPELTQKLGKSVKDVEVINYRRQLVNGINFFIKAKIIFDDDSSTIAHLRVYRPFQGTPELSAFQLDKTLEEKVDYFQ